MQKGGTKDMEGAKNCIYCMFGSISDGFCTRCRKPASEPNRPTEALPARYLLGRQYSIGRILGNGGFGITYLAFDGKNRRRVAVKELFPRYPRESFRRTGACRARALPLPGKDFRLCNKARAEPFPYITTDFLSTSWLRRGFCRPE